MCVQQRSAASEPPVGGHCGKMYSYDSGHEGTLEFSLMVAAKFRGWIKMHPKGLRLTPSNRSVLEQDTDWNDATLRLLVLQSPSPEGVKTMNSYSIWPCDPAVMSSPALTAGFFGHLFWSLFVIWLSAGGAALLFGSEEQVRVSQAAGDVWLEPGGGQHSDVR